MELYTKKIKEAILTGASSELDPKITKMIECPICRGYLIASMVTPIRCPGKDCREINSKRVAYTSTWIPLDEYIQGFKDRDAKRLADYKKNIGNI